MIVTPKVCIFYYFNERHEMSDDNSHIVILYSVSGKLFFLFYIIMKFSLLPLSLSKILKNS